MEYLPSAVVLPCMHGFLPQTPRSTPLEFFLIMVGIVAVAAAVALAARVAPELGAIATTCTSIGGHALAKALGRVEIGERFAGAMLLLTIVQLIVGFAWSM